MADVEAKVRGHCPRCGKNRWAVIHAEHDARYSNDEAGIYGCVLHRILICSGCDEVYFQRYESNNELQSLYEGIGEHEDISHWPLPQQRSRPEWLIEPFSLLDRDLNRLVNDVYVALDNDLGVLAAIGIRTAFDRASELLGIETNLTFKDKLEGLLKQGIIASDDLDHLNALTDAGNAAAHRGWRPKPKELETMMTILEMFINRAFILKLSSKLLTSVVPAKKPKAS